MNEYFVFWSEFEARAFFIDCLEKGIYVDYSRKDGVCYVGIDVTKTLEVKNAKAKN